MLDSLLSLDAIHLTLRSGHHQDQGFRHQLVRNRQYTGDVQHFNSYAVIIGSSLVRPRP